VVRGGVGGNSVCASDNGESGRFNSFLHTTYTREASPPVVGVKLAMVNLQTHKSCCAITARRWRATKQERGEI